MKRKLGGAIVKRCIVTAMTVMLVSNSVLTVRAEESVQVAGCAGTSRSTGTAAG